MRCDTKKEEMDRMKSTYENTRSEVRGASRLVDQTGYAALVACGGAAATLNLGAGAACSLALVVNHNALQSLEDSYQKLYRAHQAYKKAKAKYDKCMTGQKSAQN